MQPVLPRKKLFQRQIPTLVGLAILVIALIAGVLFIGDGLGVFAPRATPQTTPKNIRVSNITDTGFTVSFLTDESTAGFVKYGTAANEMKTQSSDDRDQLSGSVGSFTLHHVTVRGLQPSTDYYYTLGTGSQAQFDDNGSPFKVTTAKRAGAPAAAKTVYGNVTTQSGAPADGSIVYVTIDGVGEMSSLVKSSGSWAIPLSNARTTDGSGYATIDDSTVLNLFVQGPTANDQSRTSVAVSEAQPVAAITLGQDGSMAPATTTLPSPSPSPTETPATTTLNTVPETPAPASGSAGGLNELANAGTPITDDTTTSTASSSSVVDLSQTSRITVETTQPMIIGKAPANATISISVHSETEITQQVQANANGDFELDIAQLSQQLEPGQHTVQYSYTDPTSGQTVTKTKTFTVSANAVSNTALLASNTGGTAGVQPFGSGNPFPATSTPTPTPVASTSATPAASSSATKGGQSASRSSQVASGSALPRSGSVSTTFALIFGGIFFLIAGGWSLWISKQLKEEL